MDTSVAVLRAPSRIVCVLLALALSACGPQAERSSDAAPPERSARETTNETDFARATLWKPRMESVAGIDPYLAPLIYVESAVEAWDGEHSAEHDERREDAHVIGTFDADAGAGLEVDFERATVYFSDGSVVIGDRQHRQATFLWFRSLPASPQGVAEGVRITFDSSGYPAVLEPLGAPVGDRAVFVTESLERAAREQFGAAPPGQESALERARDARPRTSVVGVISDGQAPMGPFVYAARQRPGIVTLHCRCSPSRIGEVVATHEYELAPLRELAATAGALVPELETPQRPALDLRLPDVF